MFYALATRIESESHARTVIRQTRENYPDARHHCSAFVIGAEAQLHRSNDDGEPAGTAGTPILEAITGAGYSDIVVVVTRWFGGTLLGSGGLIRAYGSVTADALAAAEPVQRGLLTVLRVNAGHDIAGTLTPLLHSAEVLVDTQYGDDVTYTLASGDPDRLATQIASSSSGKAHVVFTGEDWFDLG